MKLNWTSISKKSNKVEIYKDEELTSEAISLALSASAGGSSTSTYTTLRESVRVNKGIYQSDYCK